MKVRTSLPIPAVNVALVILVDIFFSPLATSLLGRARRALMARKLIKKGSVRVDEGERASKLIAILLVLSLVTVEFGVDGHTERVTRFQKVQFYGMSGVDEDPPSYAEPQQAKSNVVVKPSGEGFDVRYASEQYEVNVMTVRINHETEGLALGPQDHDATEAKVKRETIVERHTFQTMKVVFATLESNGTICLQGVGHSGVLCFLIIRNGTRILMYNISSSSWNEARAAAKETLTKTWVDTDAKPTYDVTINVGVAGECYGMIASCAFLYALTAPHWSDVMKDITLTSNFKPTKTYIQSEMIEKRVLAEVDMRFMLIGLAIAIFSVVLLLWPIVLMRNSGIGRDLASVHEALDAQCKMTRCNVNEAARYYWTLRNTGDTLWEIGVEESPVVKTPDLHTAVFIDGKGPQGETASPDLNTAGAGVKSMIRIGSGQKSGCIP